MSKTKTGTFWDEVLAFELYKRNQGKLTRQLTAVGLGVIVIGGCVSLYQGVLHNTERAVRLGVPVLIALLAAWLIFRVVNYPRFADFLISVEAEIDKVTWASRTELYRSTIVVIGSMVLLGAVLFAFDAFWQWLFKAIGFLRFS